MPKFKITYGLGGGFNTEDCEEVEAKDLAAASMLAWEMACQTYDSYAGLHGLRDAGQIMEEDGVDEEEAEEIFREEREGWLDYSAVPL